MFRTAAILLALLATPTAASAQEAGETVYNETETVLETTTTIEGGVPSGDSRFSYTEGYGFKPSRMKQYEQGQSPWGRKPFGGLRGKKTMAASGCGPTAIAMVLATLTGETKRYTPPKVAFRFRKVYSGSHVNWYTAGSRDVISEAIRWGGLEVERIGRSFDRASETLKEGGLLIALFGPGLFTGAGHYMVIINYGGGTFGIANPNRSKHEGRRYTWSQLIREGLIQVWAVSGL